MLWSASEHTCSGQPLTISGVCTMYREGSRGERDKEGVGGGVRKIEIEKERESSFGRGERGRLGEMETKNSHSNYFNVH